MTRHIKHTIIYPCLATALLATSACTNDGDIGDLYGQWQLTEMTVDGETTSPTNCFMSFQNLTVQTRVVYTAQHTAANVTGNYQHEGDSIFMQFYLINDDIDGLSADTLISHYFKFSTPRDMRFRVEILDSKQLKLNTEESYWTFKKH